MLKITQLFLLSMAAATMAADLKEFNRVLTSGYSSKTISYDFNNGQLSNPTEIDSEENLTFMILEEKFSTVYAVHEVSSYQGTDGGAISRWKYSQDANGKATFQKIQAVTSIGSGPCHLAVDTEKGFVYSSNYGGGSFTAYKIDKNTGEILTGGGFNKFFGKGSNVIPDRQADSHPHGTYPVNQMVYVPDLGADKIWHFKVEGDSIVEATPSFTATPPGSGPRHMAFSQDKRFAYVLHELKSLIEIYGINQSSGELTLVRAVQLLEGSPIPPEVWNYPLQAASEIEIHPNGKWLYASNRLTGAIIVFQIEGDNLKFMQFSFTNGAMPRHFKIHSSGQYLINGGQDSNVLEVFAIDQENGRITKTQELASNNTPTIVLFV